MEVSRLDIFLSEFDNIRVAAARSRQDCVHDGVVLPEEHRRGRGVRMQDLLVLQKTINSAGDATGDVSYCIVSSRMLPFSGISLHSARTQTDINE